MKPHDYSSEVGKYIRAHQKRIVFSAIPLQSERSSTCGQHTVVYLYLRAMGNSRKKIYDLFNHVDLRKNDKIILNLFDEIFGVE